MADQTELFQEDIYDAFRHAVKALGGAKKVGARLWPEKPIEQAGQLLMHCLNPDRAEKLDLYQIELILREANKRGCHVASDKLGADTHYRMLPVNPEEERDQLRREYIEAVRSLERLSSQIEKFEQTEDRK